MDSVHKYKLNVMRSVTLIVDGESRDNNNNNDVECKLVNAQPKRNTKQISPRTTTDRQRAKERRNVKKISNRYMRVQSGYAMVADVFGH